MFIWAIWIPEHSFLKKNFAKFVSLKIAFSNFVTGTVPYIAKCKNSWQYEPKSVKWFPEAKLQ